MFDTYVTPTEGCVDLQEIFGSDVVCLYSVFKVGCHLPAFHNTLIR